MLYGDFGKLSIKDLNMFDKIAEPIFKTTFFSSEPFDDFNNAKVENGIIYLALPGYSKGDIEIDIQGRTLMISSTIEKEDENPFRKSFTRKWILADDANTDEIVATMNDGLLSISFGKTPENKKVKIS
jgi:HSP20 family molecular chaperone IbpA